MKSVKTLKFKLIPLTAKDKELLDYLLEEYNEIINKLLLISKYSRIYLKPSKKKLHEQSYELIRKLSDLHSNHITSARDRVIEMIKASKYHKVFPEPDRVPVRLFRNKTYQIHDNKVKIVIKPKVYAEGLLLGNDSWFGLLNLAKGAELIKKDEEYYFHVILTRKYDNYDPKYIIGIDTNLYNLTLACIRINEEIEVIATHIINFDYVYGLRLYFRNKRAYLQSIGRNIGHEEKNVIRNEIEKISNEVLKFMKPYDCIVGIESLSGVRKKLINIARAKHVRYLYSSFFYNNLLKRIKEKLEWNGYKVLEVNPYKTSTTCYKCNCIGYRKGQVFECKNCNLKINIHLSASINIAKRALKSEVLTRR